MLNLFRDKNECMHRLEWGKGACYMTPALSYEKGGSRRNRANRYLVYDMGREKKKVKLAKWGIPRVFKNKMWYPNSGSGEGQRVPAKRL